MKVALPEFSDEWSVGCKTKREAQDDSKMDRVDRMEKMMEGTG